MQGQAFEKERQQADEELSRLLGELVVKPIAKHFEESLRNELFNLGSVFEEKLKKQIAVLSKTRDLDRGFMDLRHMLEQMENDFRLQGNVTQEQAGHLKSLRAEMEAFGRQLTEQGGRSEETLLTSQTMARQLGQDFDDVRGRLEKTKEQATALGEHLLGLQAKYSEKLEGLQGVPRVLHDLRARTDVESQKMEHRMAQQSTLLDAQRREVQQLKRSLIVGFILVGGGLGALTLLTLSSSNIISFLGSA